MSLTFNEKILLQQLEQRIKQRDWEAMLEWCSFYQMEHPELIDEKIAFLLVKYYTFCMEEGSHAAALNLGALYYAGVFVEQDFGLALQCYEFASHSQEHDIATRALCNLGYCYYYGRDIPVNYPKAFDCFMLGALKGNDANCFYKLGDMYRKGYFVVKNEEIAFSFYITARDALGHHDDIYADVCARLGECYLHGIGHEKDPLLAMHYLSEAETGMYYKIKSKDPFAKGLLPKIQHQLAQAKEQAAWYARIE